MAKYKVKHTSILHNGRVYKEGSTIELTDNQAKRLEDFVEKLPTPTPAKPPQTTKTQTKTKTEKPDTSKDETEGGKDGEQDGGADNDK